MAGIGSPDERTSNQWKDWRKQLQAYIAWVNSQLKKKPGVRLVEDLRHDLRDGVALVQLVDIVAGEQLPGVHMVPANQTEMRENIERVLHFMMTNRIRMHHITAKDVVEGNLKSIMRLILCLAAHFKPHSVKHSTSQQNLANKSSNVAGIAQGAAATLADARRTVARAGQSFRKNRSDHRSDQRKSYQESSSDQYSDSDQSYVCEGPKSYRGQSRGRVEGASASSSPTSSVYHSPQSSFSVGPSPRLTDTPTSLLSSSKSLEYVSAKDSGTELEDSGNNNRVPGRPRIEELLHEYNELEFTMSQTKSELLSLQDLLLSGEPPDGEESPTLPQKIEPTTLEEQIVVFKSRLQQSTELCINLKDELSKSKIECMQLQGTKSGLQQRLAEEDENRSYRNNLKKKDKVISDLKKDIIRRDQRIDQLQYDLQMKAQEKEKVTKGLKSEIKELHDRLKMVGETGATLSAKVAHQDKRMAKLEGKILSSHENPDKTSDLTIAQRSSCDELEFVWDSLNSLRESFQSTDPSQHTIDTLEQSISTLMDRIHWQVPNNSLAQVIDEHLLWNQNSTYETLLHLASMENKMKAKSVLFQFIQWKKRKTTPLGVHKNENISKIRIAINISRITNEDDIIPGWEGKIVAWIVENTS
ncbi:hypothetical protein ScPMuIL_002487 [Solemya velum]